MKRKLATSLGLAALALGMSATAASARTIIFVGNSFLFASHTAVMHYKPDTVTDLNGTNIGGVPALFKSFTKQVGLDYDVSMETVGGKGFDYHYNEKLSVITAKSYDDIILQGYSTLDEKNPGNPALLIKYTKMLGDAMRAKSPSAKIYLDATWSRADQTYPEGRPWHGKPIEQMGIDVDKAYQAAAKEAGKSVNGIVTVGLAFNRAMKTNIADTNPYDGISANQTNLWTWDNYHASPSGLYLEALMIFGAVTGKDPLVLGNKEPCAEDLEISPTLRVALQQVAHDELMAHGVSIAMK